MHASFVSRTRWLRIDPVVAAATAVVAAFLVALSLPADAAASSATPALTPPASISGLKSAEVESLLASTPLEDLSAADLSKPISELSGLGILPSGSLQQALTATIEELAHKGGTLGELGDSSAVVSELSAQLNKIVPAGLLSLLLNGESLSNVLTSGLGSLNPTQLVEGLLTSASEPEREQLVEGILDEVAPELQSLLGSTLSGEPFERTDVKELASKLGTTTDGLDESLEATTEEIPPTAMALTAPLTDGKLLSALEGVDGLHLAVLSTPEGSGGGSGSSGGGTGGSGGSSGGAGGSGGSSSGTPAGTTLVVNPAATSASVSAANAAAKVKILSHKVEGHAVTLVVQVPAAGTLKVRGNGLRTVARQVARAERVTLRMVPSKAGAASLRKHRNGLAVKLVASFAPVGGASSSASTSARLG
jgi:hypothetical protein